MRQAGADVTVARSSFVWDRLLKPYQRASPFFAEFAAPTRAEAPTSAATVAQQTPALSTAKVSHHNILVGVSDWDIMRASIHI